MPSFADLAAALAAVAFSAGFPLIGEAIRFLFS